MIIWHNWKSDYKIKLSYETIIFESHLKKEQRRSLRTEPLIQISILASFLDRNDAQSFLGLSLSTFYLPIEIEYFTGTRGAAGTKKITVSSSITYHWYLKNISNLYLLDNDENRAVITSIVGSQINLDQDLAGTSTDFWPAIKCFVKDIDQKFLTDNALETALLFEQIKE